MGEISCLFVNTAMSHVTINENGSPVDGGRGSMLRVVNTSGRISSDTTSRPSLEGLGLQGSNGQEGTRSIDNSTNALDGIASNTANSAQVDGRNVASPTNQTIEPPPDYDQAVDINITVNNEEIPETQDDNAVGLVGESLSPSPSQVLAPPPGYPGASSSRDQTQGTEEDPQYLPRYPPKDIDIEILKVQLASLSTLADQVVQGLNRHADRVGYEKHPSLRCVVAELTALYMTLTNLEKVFQPSTERYLDFWLETLELVLQIAGDPLEDLLAVLSAADEGAQSPPSPKWKRLFRLQNSSESKTSSSPFGSSSSSTRQRSTSGSGENITSSGGKWSSMSYFFTNKEKQRRDEVTESIVYYEKRTVPYTQMFNLLYTSCLPDFTEQREPAIERVLKLLRDPNGLAKAGLDIRLADDVPVEILGHWVPEVVMIGGIEYPQGSVGVIIKKHKKSKRIFVELAMDRGDNENNSTFTYTVSRSTKCDRGVGNDPLVLHDVLTSGEEGERTDDIYIWLNSWLERDAFCLSFTALKWLNDDWFPRTNRKGRYHW